MEYQQKMIENSTSFLKKKIETAQQTGCHEMPSKGFGQIQISYVAQQLALQQETPVQYQKTYYPGTVYSIRRCVFTLLWLNLDTCSVDSKHFATVTDNRTKLV